jgi:Fe2+ transport system protein FeoA
MRVLGSRPAPANCLAQLPLGEPGHIKEFGSLLAGDTALQLMEHGMVPGTAVRVVHRFGSGMVLELRGTRLMLHASVAERVHLQDAAPVAV